MKFVLCFLVLVVVGSGAVAGHSLGHDASGQHTRGAVYHSHHQQYRDGVTASRNHAGYPASYDSYSTTYRSKIHHAQGKRDAHSYPLGHSYGYGPHGHNYGLHGHSNGSHTYSNVSHPIKHYVSKAYHTHGKREASPYLISHSYGKHGHNYGKYGSHGHNYGKYGSHGHNYGSHAHNNGSQPAKHYVNKAYHTHGKREASPYLISHSYGTHGHNYGKYGSHEHNYGSHAHNNGSHPVKHYVSKAYHTHGKREASPYLISHSYGTHGHKYGKYGSHGHNYGSHAYSNGSHPAKHYVSKVYHTHGKREADPYLISPSYGRHGHIPSLSGSINGFQTTLQFTGPSQTRESKLVDPLGHES
ncbi:hornerin-like [Palaemon carinicauda]|uniref:hornerin-like n=1 Tax=Palaemon carinicauda TaxID=392227 RepID=UPI0035B682DA